MIAHILKLMRLHHWVKNLMIFLPAFFAGVFSFDSGVSNLIIAFVSFSFAASGIYVVNDIRDLQFDKLHPQKKLRPIASGTVSDMKAKLIAVGCFVVAIVASFLLGSEFRIILISYIILNFLYSYFLKSIAVVDLLIIASGFLLRVYAGGFVADIPISKWLFLLVFELSIFIGLAKRRDDLLVLENTGEAVRKSISGYSLKFIDFAMVFIASITVLSYVMYTLSEEVVARIGTDILHWSAIFVIVGILRYMQITWVAKKSGSPVRLILSDAALIVLVLGWISFFAYCLYF